MTKQELKVVYELRSIIAEMNWNECDDKNNPMRADKRKQLFEKGQEIASQIINKYPPLKS